MKLQQYITEDSFSNIDDMITAIKRDCGKWLKESNGRAAFRGMKNKPDMYLATVRDNRKPKDTSKVVHDMMNKSLSDKFGWKPRSEGMFCTGDMWVASQYGKPYMVFPVSDYRYIWSPTVSDSYADTSKFSTWWAELVSMFLKDEYVDEYVKTKETQQMLKSYKDTGLYKALKDKNEIMVECKKYYAIRPESIVRPFNPDGKYDSYQEFIKDLY